VGGWSTSTDRLNLTYHAEIKILGVTFASTIEHSMNKSWSNVTGPVKVHKREELKPLTTDSLRTSIPLSDNMAHGPSVSDTHDVYPTIDECYREVHMEGTNVPCTNIDSSETEETRRLGLN